MTYPVNDMSYILENIQIDENSGCWLWRGSIHHSGYGTVKRSIDGQKYNTAHRYAFHCFYGYSPLECCHTCDVKQCCNPLHLYNGTPKTNAQDRVSRGQQSRGEKHVAAKLTNNDVAEIRQLYSTGKYSTRLLGEMFGVSHMCIGDIIRGVTWTHI